MLEHNDVRAKLLQQASGALWTAVENVSDAVEILSDTHQLQVIHTHTHTHPYPHPTHTVIHGHNYIGRMSVVIRE